MKITAEREKQIQKKKKNNRKEQRDRGQKL